MKIDSSVITMQSQHFSATRTEERQSLRAWIGQERPDFEGAQRGRQPAPLPPPVDLSAAGKSAQAAEADAIAQAADAAASDPFLQLIKSMVEWMTGKSIQVFHASQLDATTPTDIPQQPSGRASGPQTPLRVGSGVEYDYHATHEEFEQTTFSAQGSIKTADGSEIAFRLDLSMTRQYREDVDISVRTGDGVRKDPLVVNFDGAVAQLSSQSFRFDLEGKGKAVDVPLLGEGSGYLALDLNGNGKIDSGKELFGPGSSSGFAELARHDGDGNGWIDENDAVFKQLRVWTPAADGGGLLSTLKDRDVGALYLGHTATPFELRSAANVDLGAVRASGVYVSESGQTGSLQEIDLTV